VLRCLWDNDEDDDEGEGEGEGDVSGLFCWSRYCFNTKRYIINSVGDFNKRSLMCEAESGDDADDDDGTDDGAAAAADDDDVDDVVDDGSGVSVATSALPEADAVDCWEVGILDKNLHSFLWTFHAAFWQAGREQ
jgi:hypothetical protein